MSDDRRETGAPPAGADARKLPDGTLVTCEHCPLPHPKGDDGRECLFPKVAAVPVAGTPRRESAREVLARLGGTMPTEEQQQANLDANLDGNVRPTADRRETGAPPDPDECKRCGMPDLVCRCPEPADEIRAIASMFPRAPVAGSASFSEAPDYDVIEAAYLASNADGAFRAALDAAFHQGRARVESLHRDEVERLTKERDAQGEMAVGYRSSWLSEENKRFVAERERDEARAERDRLATALRGLLRESGGDLPDLDFMSPGEEEARAVLAALPGHRERADRLAALLRRRIDLWDGPLRGDDYDVAEGEWEREVRALASPETPNSKDKP